MNPIYLGQQRFTPRVQGRSRSWESKRIKKKKTKKIELESIVGVKKTGRPKSEPGVGFNKTGTPKFDSGVDIQKN